MSRKDKFKRQCIVCREFKDKSELVRFTKNFNTQEIEINENNAFIGRSAYVCNRSECIETAVKKQMIEKRLKSKFSENTLKKLS